MQNKPIQKRTKNKLRNARIRAMAAEGKTQTEIGDELGLSRVAVNRVLNSEESQLLVKQHESKLVEIGGKAVQALDDALENRENDLQTAVRAAGIILKAIGLDQKKSDSSDVSQPFIVKFLNGDQIVLGHGVKPQAKAAENEDE